MPTNNGPVTLYNVKGDSIQVAPELLQKAHAKGWTINNPKEGSGTMDKIGFGKGVAAGVNPFHQAPQNMPVPGTMGGVTKGAADSVNMREIFNRATHGDKAGAAGEAVGTAAGLFGPSEIGKALKASGAAARVLKVPGIAEAADKAVQLKKSLGPVISGEAARFAEEYVKPLRTALDTKFQAVHDALKGSAVPVTAKLNQLINRLQKSEVPAIKKIAFEFGPKAKGFLQHQGRSALDYMEAEGIRRELKESIKSLPSHSRAVAHEFAEELDSEIQKLANSKGFGAARQQLKTLAKDISQIAKSTAAHAEEKSSAAQRALKAISKKAGVEIGDTTAKLKVDPAIRKYAIDIAKKLGVDTSHFVETTGREKVGTAIKAAGSVERAGAAGRGVVSGVSQDQ